MISVWVEATTTMQAAAKIKVHCECCAKINKHVLRMNQVLFVPT